MRTNGNCLHILGHFFNQFKVITVTSVINKTRSPVKCNEPEHTILILYTQCALECTSKFRIFMYIFHNNPKATRWIPPMQCLLRYSKSGLVPIQAFPCFSMHVRKIGKAWSIRWCNDDVSATISATNCRNGDRYVIITSPHRPGLPNFSPAHRKHGKAWIQGYSQPTYEIVKGSHWSWGTYQPWELGMVG